MFMSEVYISCHFVLYVYYHFVLYVNYHFVLYVNCKEEVGIIFPPCHKEGRSDIYPYASNVANWYRLECIEVKDLDSDMDRWHGRQKLQAPNQAFKLRM